MLSKISLPPTELMEDLLREYFDSDWITMPLVHKPSFFAKYDRLIAVSNSRYRRDIPLDEATELAATYCVLFGMLALGERARCGRADTVTEVANGIEFHDQARGLLMADLISTPSPLVVQAMLVHARFLRRNGSDQESWVMIGLAHRLAEGLLLHIDVPGKTQAEQEERRRTWCACALLMRWVSSRRNCWFLTDWLPLECKASPMESLQHPIPNLESSLQKSMTNISRVTFATWSEINRPRSLHPSLSSFATFACSTLSSSQSRRSSSTKETTMRRKPLLMF